MKLYYDLHIHSALSPCGDGDMTPNNIVNMASLKGLDIIAVSDHNSAKNCRAAVLAAKRNCPDLLVVPAIEAESSEEVHILCLFPTLDGAEQMGEALTQSLFLPNKPELFGRQMVLNENDEVAGEEEKLLISASGFSLFEIKNMTESLGGVAICAHIDRTSNSVLSNLGFVPPQAGFTALELSKNGRQDDYKHLGGYRFISNSDAHYLPDISERVNFLELEDKNVENLLEFLRKKQNFV